MHVYRKNRRKTIVRMLLPAVMLFLCILLNACGSSEQEASGTGMYFDTVVDIRIYDKNADKLLDQCFAECERLENILSAQKETSELYQLNRQTLSPGEGAEVSDELAACIAKGLEYGEISGGLFDITILPLRELWDFEGEDPSVPAEEDIRTALEKVDYRKVHIEGNKVSFDDPDIRIDLGGIAKGYISLCLKELLEEQGCRSALINLGGNVSAIGTKPDGSSWVVGIQEPFTDRGTVFETVDISGGSVISSGTYERYFEEDGKRYHHILDPRTGYPAQTGLQQATVIGEDDVLGDAFSTICIAAGQEKAEEIAADQGWDVRILFIDESGTGTWYPG